VSWTRWSCANRCRRRSGAERDRKALGLQRRQAEEKPVQMEEAERLRLGKAEKNRQHLNKLEEERKAEVGRQEREIHRLKKSEAELAEKRDQQVKTARRARGARRPTSAAGSGTRACKRWRSGARRRETFSRAAPAGGWCSAGLRLSIGRQEEEIECPTRTSGAG
jgi:hypothetical protein